MTDLDTSTTADTFITARYAELVENPIMYSKPDYTTFTVDGMEIILVFILLLEKLLPQSITPEMKTMMTAQKNLLGKINATKKIQCFVYMGENDAKGFGASQLTTRVVLQVMPKELVKSMMDVVSMNFHIVTPLSIHSKEIKISIIMT
jgi:predicted metalloprotease with PDZ domain